MKKLLLLFLLTPLTAFAAQTHNFVCADLNPGRGASCTSNVFTFVSNPSGSYMETIGSVYPMTNGVTYYLSATYSGSGTIKWYDTSQVVHADFSSTQTAMPMTNSGATADYWFFLMTANQGPADISNICITDVSGACEGGGATPMSILAAILQWRIF